MDGKDLSKKTSDVSNKRFNQDGYFLRCQKCGKKLIKRLPNGIYQFVFGKKDGSRRRPPVNIEIVGSVRMDCLNPECDFKSILNFFPPYMEVKKMDKEVDKEVDKTKQEDTPVVTSK